MFQFFWVPEFFLCQIQRHFRITATRLLVKTIFLVPMPLVIKPNVGPGRNNFSHWRIPSYGILRRVALIRTDVSEPLSSSETSVLTKATRHNIPEDGILHSHLLENLKSYIFLIVRLYGLHRKYRIIGVLDFSHLPDSKSYGNIACLKLDPDLVQW
jgi:hypothetical protein